MALTDNLISVWELSEASGNALDSHGSNDLTETSGTIAAASGPSGLSGARDFEAGDTEYFEIADNTDLSTGDIDFTFAAWVNLESGGADRTVLAKYNTTGNQREYWLDYEGATANRFRFIVSSNGSGGGSVGTVTANNFGAASTGTWYHVVAWHDSVNNQTGISVNAGTPDTLSWTGGVFNSTSAFRLGDTSNNLAPWDGLIAQVALWKRVLTSDERTTLYASGAGLPYSSWGGASYTLTASTGSFALTGQAAALRPARVLTSAQSSFTLAGQAAALRAARVLASSQASYTLSGQDAALRPGRLVAASQASFALSGQAVALRAARVLVSSQASYTLSGQDATLVHSASGNKSLAADQAAFAMSGQAAALRAARRLTSSQASFALAGQAAGLRAARRLASAQASFSLTGQTALLLAARRVAAAQASFLHSGQAATLARAVTLASSRGDFALTGQAAALRAGRVMSAAAGAFVLSGRDATLAYSAALATIATLALPARWDWAAALAARWAYEVNLPAERDE